MIAGGKLHSLVITFGARVHLSSVFMAFYFKESEAENPSYLSLGNMTRYSRKRGLQQFGDAYGCSWHAKAYDTEQFEV